MKHMVMVATILSILSAAAFAEEDEINWTTTWDEAVEASAESSKPVLILFTNPERCPPCRMLDANTLPDAEVTAFINENFVPLLAHTGIRENQVLAGKFGIRGIPTFIITDSDKNEIARIVGYQPPAQFIESMKSKMQNGSNTLIYIIISMVVLAGIVYFMSRNRRTRNKGK